MSTSVDKNNRVQGILDPINLFGFKKSPELEDLRTEEQKASQAILQGLATTGSGGGIDLGEAYGGSLGNYNQSNVSSGALSGLQGLINGQDINGARDVYSRMANNQFNPDDPSSGYAAYSRALAKSGAKSSDVLNREAAITGSRFGTGIQGRKADLSADLANQRGMFLADLYNQGENRALQGASGLSSLANQQSGMYGNLFNMGDYQRQLDTQKANAELKEFNRQRGEELSRIGLLQTEANRAPFTGLSSIPDPETGGADLINGVLNFAASYFGGEGSFGKSDSSSLSSMFGSGASSSYMNNNYGGTSRFANTGKAGQQPSWF